MKRDPKLRPRPLSGASHYVCLLFAASAFCIFLQALTTNGIARLLVPGIVLAPPPPGLAALKASVVPLCRGRCNVWVSFQSVSQEHGHGWGQWGVLALASIRRLNAEIRYVPSSPDDAQQKMQIDNETVAVLLQGIEPFDLKWLQQIPADHVLRQDRRVFLGPFAANHVHKLTPDMRRMLSGTTILLHHEGGRDKCTEIAKRELPLTSCAMWAPGIDDALYAPSLPRVKRRSPVIFLKAREGMRINDAVMQDSLRLAKIYSYSLLRTAHGGPESFHPQQYLAALKNAPYMIAFTPLEQFGFFLAEAASFDVPTLLLLMRPFPEWFVDSSAYGRTRIIPVDGTFNATEMADVMADFVANVAPNLEPRAALQRQFSFDAAARRFAAEVLQRCTTSLCAQI